MKSDKMAEVGQVSGFGPELFQNLNCFANEKCEICLEFLSALRTITLEPFIFSSSFSEIKDASVI